MYSKSRIRDQGPNGVAVLAHQHTLLVGVFFMGIVQWVLVIMSWNKDSGKDVLGEPHGLVPKFNTELVRFNSTREDGARAMNETDPAWTSIMPNGGGFVVVDGWDEFHDSLPPPIEFDGKDVYSVAVFHQLHCLHYMLTEFNKFLDHNRTMFEPVDGHSHSRRKMPGHNHSTDSEEETIKHVGHCFDYLRNSLMCCGDAAFEGQGSDIEEAGTLGEASYHMCRNYDEIKDWAEEYRAANMRGFGD